MEDFEVIGRENQKKKKIINRHILLKYKTTMKYRRINSLSKFYIFMSIFQISLYLKNHLFIYVCRSSIWSQCS